MQANKDTVIAICRPILISSHQNNYSISWFMMYSMQQSVHIRMNVFCLNRTGMYFLRHTRLKFTEDHALIMSSNYDFKFRELEQERLLLREINSIYATTFNDSIAFKRTPRLQGFGNTSQIP